MVTPLRLNRLAGLGFSISSSGGFEFSLKDGANEIDSKLQGLMPTAFNLIDGQIEDEANLDEDADEYSRKLKWLLLEKNRSVVDVVPHLPFPNVEDLKAHTDKNAKRSWPKNELFLSKLQSVPFCHINLVKFHFSVTTEAVKTAELNTIGMTF